MRLNLRRTNPFLSRVMNVLRRDAPRVPPDQPYNVRLDRSAGGTFAQVWFLTQGCSWDRAGACTMCNYGRGPAVSDDAMVASVRAALESIDEPVDELFVSPSGSMLDPAEVPPAARERIYGEMARFGARRVCVETRSETVNADTVLELREAFADKHVTVELGLESSSAFLQRYAINRMSEPRVFEEASAMLRSGGIRVGANIALGSAFLSTAEAIDDASASVAWALARGANLAVVFPMHVKPHTLLAWLHERGAYQPPSLWSLIETLSRVAPRDLSRVTISWYRSNYAASGPFRYAPTTCPTCRERVLRGLDRFRDAPGVTALAALRSEDCACKEVWARDAGSAPSAALTERILQHYAVIAEGLGLADWWRAHATEVSASMSAD